MTLSCAFLVGAVRADEPLRITFAHVLSDFSGPVRLGEARVALAEPGSAEVVVAQGRDVRFFNRAGMEEFRFRTSLDLGNVFDTAADSGGGLLTLAYALDAPGDRPRYVITRHDYRGVKTGELTPTGLPPEFAGLLPNRMLFQQDGLLLASTGQMLAVVLDREGRFVRGYDLFDILEMDPEERGSHNITALRLDDHGNLLITCATLFSVFVVSPEGELIARWGEPGSAPGKFNVVSGVARDAAGRYFVADQLRATISVFDEDFTFLQEFGGQPTPAGRLGIPKELLFDGLGRLFITQVGERGVWVYDVRKTGP